MLANKSIRYLSRQEIKVNGRVVTVRDLRDFLTTLIDGGCGDFEIMTTVAITHYTLNGHRLTLTLD